MWIDGEFYRTRDYTAKYKFNNMDDWYKFTFLLGQIASSTQSITNILFYDIRELKWVYPNSPIETNTYYVIFNFEIIKHYGARRWLKENFNLEPDVCWMRFSTDLDPLLVLEDIL